jgi:hypothetical protein
MNDNAFFTKKNSKYFDHFQSVLITLLESVACRAVRGGGDYDGLVFYRLCADTFDILAGPMESICVV